MYWWLFIVRRRGSMSRVTMFQKQVFALLRPASLLVLCFQSTYTICLYSCIIDHSFVHPAYLRTYVIPPNIWLIDTWYNVQAPSIIFVRWFWSDFYIISKYIYPMILPLIIFYQDLSNPLAAYTVIMVVNSDRFHFWNCSLHKSW